MIEGFKLSSRKKNLKKLMMREAYLRGDMISYYKHRYEYNKMIKMRKYLHSDFILLENISDIAPTLNQITRIATNLELYEQVVNDLERKIDKLSK